MQKEFLPTNSLIQTDAPVDNNGKGELFSPTDLVASGLGTCMLTVMGIYAESRNMDLSGSHFHVKKIMTSNPRRISEIKINMHLPKTLDTDSQEKLKNICQHIYERLPMLVVRATQLSVWRRSV